MQMRRLAITLFCLLPMAALLYGCGSSSKSGGSINNVATVGDTACVQCHSAAQDPLTGEGIVAQYNKSAHYASGQGCESCHGGGAQHNGVGPIPYPAPGATQCATCHDGTTAQATNSTEYVNSNHAILDTHYSATDPTRTLCLRCHSYEGAVIFNQRGITGDKTFLTAATTTSQLFLDRDGTQFQAINCQTCHEHGGALRAQYAQVSTADSTKVAWDPNKNLKVDQFDLCTSCHTFIANDGTTLVASGTAIAGRTAFYHNDRWNRMIATTHYDDPTSGYGLATTNMEGYVIRTKGANPCFDCHGHEAKTATGSATESTTHTDWAQSGHGAEILTYKLAALAANPTRNDAQVDAIIAAGPDESQSSWPHYDWDASNRGSCQRCHSTTGAASFMTSPAKFDAQGNNDVANGYYVAQTFVTDASDPLRTTKNAKLNSFTHLSGWSRNSTTGVVTSSGQNEALYCWGCHSNAGTGALRNPGAFSFWYGNTLTNANPNGLLVSFPDAKNSNGCMTCHSGRTQIAQNIVRDNRDGSNVAFMYPHYMPSALIVNGNGGYEYATRTYTAPSYFAHDKIGISAAGTGTTSGPCAGCHMSSPNKHKFTNVTKDGTGLITAITSTLCATCHSGDYALTATKMNEEKEGYEAALAALAGAFEAINIHYDSHSNPYFFIPATATSFTNWAAPYGAASWKNVMGAAYNLYTLGHDGGYAHNRYYAKRLIWDSIDFIYNGTLDNDITAAIDAQATAGRITAAQATAAKAYLGATRP